MKVTLTPLRLPNVALPLILERVSAGFPSPADDFIEGHINLNKQLIEHPDSTFFLRVSGESMTGAGIYPNDILIVDRSLSPKKSDIVVASIDGELLVKEFIQKNGKTWLNSANNSYPPILIKPDNDLMIFGVVVYTIHKPGKF